MKKLIFLLLIATPAFSNEWSYRNRRNLSADIVSRFGITENQTRPQETVKLYNFNSRLSMLGDCGNLDFRASFRSLYDETKRLFTDLREAALGSASSVFKAAPMLSLCYFSPTACSIAKNLQIYSSFTTKLKFDQCQAINRYMDGRASTYKQAQGDCLRREMAKTGNVSQAVDSCKSSADKLLSWVDGSNAIKLSSNAIVKESAQWAGISKDNTSLLQAILGGVEYEASGRTRVDYGGNDPMTPGKLLDFYNRTAFQKLCGKTGILGKYGKERTLSQTNLRYFSSKGRSLIDPEVIEALDRLPISAREAACDRLASASSMSKFVDQMNEHFDQLYIMSQNPNMPAEAVEILEKKTKKLVDHTLAVIQIRNLRRDSLNAVRSDILLSAEHASTREKIRASDLSSSKHKSPFEECDDFTNCRKH